MIFPVAQKMLYVPKKIVIVPDIMVSAVQNIISAAKQMLSEAGKMRLVPIRSSKHIGEIAPGKSRIIGD